MVPPTRQLALPFPIDRRCSFANFHVGDNAEAVQHLQQLAERSGFAGAWLWGIPGSGVSHLLQAVCQYYGERGRRATYLPLAAVAGEEGLLEGMDAFQLVALDDLQAWQDDSTLQRALLALYEQLRDRGHHLLAGAAGPAARCGFTLADLGSRFAALPSYRLRTLNDDGKSELLRRLARERGLELSDSVLSFWMARSDRSMGRLLNQLDVIDGATLEAQRTVTIPLVKEALGL